jgi:hypothetical protein
VARALATTIGASGVSIIGVSESVVMVVSVMTGVSGVAFWEMVVLAFFAIFSSWALGTVPKRRLSYLKSKRL